MPSRACLAIVIPATFCAGCAIHPVPSEQVAASRNAIDLARVEGVDPREVARAREKLDLSARWIAARDNEPARWLAEQAQVDAELARARAAADRAVEEARRKETPR